MGSLPLGTREVFAICLGRLIYAVDKRRREIAIKNLTIAFGKEKSAADIRAIAIRSFQNLGRIMFEIGWTMRTSKTELAKHFNIVGLENYKQAQSEDKGVFLMGAHHGNWELLPIGLYLAQTPMGMVYRPIDLPALDLLVKENRSRFGSIPIRTRKKAARKIFQTLKKGNPIGLLIDQNEIRRHGIFVDFFKYEACTNPGLAKMSLKIGAPVVPFFLIRQANQFIMEFGPAVKPIQTGDQDTDVALNMRKYNEIIESYIRRYPDQYLWAHDRWRTRPVPSGRSSRKKSR